MKLKCIHSDGCPYWTEGGVYAVNYNYGFLFVDDNDNIGCHWFLEDNNDGTYSPAGITHRVNFIIDD